MKAAQIVRPGEVTFVDISARDPGTGQVVVRPLLISLCGSDVNLYARGHPQDYPLAVGTTGHEVIGIVERVGAGVVGLAAHTPVLALSPEQTAMAEQFCAEEDCVLPLPKDTPFEELVLAQQLGTVIYAIRRLPSLVGTSAVVIGQGSAGILWAQMLRRLGCARIITMDLLDARVAAGRRFGADLSFNNGNHDPREVVREATGGVGADIVIEASGDGEAANLAARLVRQRGILYYFGIPHTPGFRFDFETFFRAYATTFSTSGAMLEPGKGSFRLALELISRGSVDVRGMITHRIPFEDLPKAYELARTGADGAVKVLVEMPGAAEYITANE